jgi:AcrR family transcriptional regulator
MKASSRSYARAPLDRALIELCYERGFAELSVEDLCRRAGVEPTEFDRQYADLEDCFCQVYEQLAAEFLARMEDAYQSEQGWRNQLRAVAYACLLHLEEDPARAHFTVLEALNAGEGARLISGRVMAELSSYVDRGREQAGAPGSLSANTAESLNGAVFHQMLAAIAHDQYERFAEFLPELMYAVVLPYLGPEAAAEELEIGPPALPVRR